MTHNTIALFNYGGGMRGLIPAHFMARLEETTGLRMVDMVDLFTGPSTGAILNAALNVRQAEHPSLPRYRARHMVRFYEREGERIFPPDRYRELRGIIHDFNNRTLRLNQLKSLVNHGHYDPSHLSRALRALFGDSRLSDSLKNLIVPCYNIDGGQIEIVREADDPPDPSRHARSTIVDRGGHAVWLKSIKSGMPGGGAHTAPDVSMYDAVMASCAAPTYFPCHHFTMFQPGSGARASVSGIDGNLFDNPCITYLGALRRHVPKDSRLIMIVLGTGHTNRSIRREDWNRYGALGVVDPVNDLPLINIFFHASESALMDVFEEEMGENLFVFNKIMGGPDAPSTQIDDASPENLRRLHIFFEEMLEENKSRFEALCHILVNRRDARQEQKRETLLQRSQKYFTLFRNLHAADRAAVADHEAEGA